LGRLIKRAATQTSSDLDERLMTSSGRSDLSLGPAHRPGRRRGADASTARVGGRRHAAAAFVQQLAVRLTGWEATTSSCATGIPVAGPMRGQAPIPGLHTL
jgi:hypothetical protein